MKRQQNQQPQRPGLTPDGRIDMTEAIVQWEQDIAEELAAEAADREAERLLRLWGLLR